MTGLTRFSRVGMLIAVWHEPTDKQRARIAPRLRRHRVSPEMTAVKLIGSCRDGIGSGTKVTGGDLSKRA